MHPRTLLVFAALACGIAPAAAQHFLAVRDGDKLKPVVDADGTVPLVLENGRLASMRSSRFILGKGGEYLPCHVAVRDVLVRTSSVVVDGANEMNKEFSLRARLETSYPLAHVFVVLVLHQDRESSLFLYGVGRLQPRESRWIDVRVPMQTENRPGRYEFYLFSGGRELFQTLMPIGEMEYALNRMVADRIRDVRDAPPSPFVGPAPEYPKALLKRKVTGTAVITLTIEPNGTVYHPSVQSASAPEFGQSALTAIREWRFLPQVRNGVPVETKATMPFEFAPPSEK